MNISSFPFQTLNWSSIPKKNIKVKSGFAYWQVFMMGEIRVRKVEYSQVIKPIIGVRKAISFFVLKEKWTQNWMMAAS
jgi:hypothetical protein